MTGLKPPSEWGMSNATMKVPDHSPTQLRRIGASIKVDGAAQRLESLWRQIARIPCSLQQLQCHDRKENGFVTEPIGLAGVGRHGASLSSTTM